LDASVGDLLEFGKRCPVTSPREFLDSLER
jgi:hypothetical protein